MTDHYYHVLQTGQLDANGINQAYWTKVRATNFSAEFKHLMQAIFSHNPAYRPTLADIKNHPWFHNRLNLSGNEEIR